MRPSDLYILTGAPGSGKTAILESIGSDVRWVLEPAREILAEQRSVGGAGTHDLDRALFVELLLQRSIDKHEAAQRSDGIAVFDRGVPDCIAYAILMGADPTPSIRATEVYRYHDEVLVLEPWEDIYTVDEERTMSFADTLPFQRALVDAYEMAGYVLVDVPRDSVENRVAFVRGFIERARG